MPRPLRRAYAGAIYQVLNRGDRREERQRFGWHPAALRQACKGGERKVRPTARIRTETTLSLKWIAEPPAMGSLTHVSNLLVAERKRERLKSEN